MTASLRSEGALRALGRQQRGVRHGGGGEEVVVGVLEFAKGFSDISAVAKAIYKLTPDKQTAANQLFKHYKLDNKIPDIFTNANFQKWEKTVTSSFKTNPDAANTVMFLTLKSQFGDEGLAKMLSTTREVSDSSSIAGRLQGAQFTSWVKSKITVNDAFKILSLDQAGDQILTTPAFRSWISYSQEVGRAGRFDVVSTLVSRYGDETLAKMLYTAKDVSATKTLATELQNIHLAQWLRDEKTGAEAFKILKLDTAGETIFQSPAFNTWASYAWAMEKKNAYSTDVALGDSYSMLLKRFDEVDLAKLLVAAKDDASSPAIAKSVVAQLQNMQFKSWKERRLDPNQVTLKMMKISGVNKWNEAAVVDYHHFYYGIKD